MTTKEKMLQGVENMMQMLDYEPDMPGNQHSCDVGIMFSLAAYVLLIMRENGIDAWEDNNERIKELLAERLHNSEFVDVAMRAIYWGFLDWLLNDGIYSGQADEELFDLIFAFDDRNRFAKSWKQDGTPDSIAKLVEAVLDIQNGESVADLGCGRGDFLVEAQRNHSDLHLYGIDIDRECATLAAARLDALGADAAIELGDMFVAPQRGTFDKVFSNYPFGVRPSSMRGVGEYYESLRTGKDGIGRPASADWLFNKLAFDSLKEGGTALTVMTNGAAFNGGDKQARKYFVNNGMIKAIVALPANLFPGTSIPAVLLVLGKNDGPIRMVDASELSITGRRWDTMGEDEIKEILNRLVNDGENSRLVDPKDIAASEYNLFPQRYLSRTISLENPTRLGDLALSIERGAGLTAKDLDALASNEDTGLCYLRLADIKDGLIGNDLPCLRELDPKTERQWLRTGDLIVSKNGAPFKIAVADVPNGKTILANGNLYIIRLDTDRINPYFAAAFLASEDGKELMDRMVVGTTIPNLPLGNLKDILMPVPDMETQEKVARQYQARIDEIEVLKIKLEKARVGVSCTYDEVMGR